MGTEMVRHFGASLVLKCPCSGCWSANAQVSAQAADRILEQLSGQELLVRGKSRRGDLFFGFFPDAWDSRKKWFDGVHGSHSNGQPQSDWRKSRNSGRELKGNPGCSAKLASSW